MIGDEFFISRIKGNKSCPFLYKKHANHYALGHHSILLRTHGRLARYASQNVNPASSLARFYRTQCWF